MTRTSFRRMLWKTPLRDLVRGRITGRLDIDRLLDEASLSGQAADKVRRVVKYTRLWRLEKVDVARELIAHFTDGLEAEVPMDELIETFGDERQTAKLIRRAKKRQRAMPWHVFAWARLCFLVFFGAYFLAALYLMTGSPSVTTDYLAKLNSKAASVPAEEAAWPIYREALLAMGYSLHGEQDGLPIDASLSPGNEKWPVLLAFLNARVESLAKVRKAAMLPRSGHLVGFTTLPEDEVIFEPSDLAGYYDDEESHPPLIGVLLTHLGPLRAMSRLMAADTSRAIEAGDGETAYDNVVAMFGIARHADEHPLLINGMVRLSIQNHAYRSIQEVMTTRPDLWSDEQLRDLAHRIAGIEITPEDWFNGERLWFYDYLQRAYTDDGRGGGRITAQGMDSSAMYSPTLLRPMQSTPRKAIIAFGLPVAATMIAPRDEMREVYDELIDRTIVKSHQPLWIDDGAETVDESLQKLQDTTIKAIRYMPILMFMPSMSAISRTVHTQEGYRDGVLIGIALEHYRREHGDWPGTLEDLVPGYLPSVPLDRLTGETVKYRVREDGPVVYSVGVDGDDDGGRPPVERDGDIANDMASPKQFDAVDKTDAAYDGDWVLWPVPYQQ